MEEHRRSALASPIIRQRPNSIGATYSSSRTLHSQSVLCVTFARARNTNDGKCFIHPTTTTGHTGCQRRHTHIARRSASCIFLLLVRCAARAFVAFRCKKRTGNKTTQKNVSGSVHGLHTNTSQTPDAQGYFSSSGTRTPGANNACTLSCVMVMCVERLCVVVLSIRNGCVSYVECVQFTIYNAMMRSCTIYTIV